MWRGNARRPAPVPVRQVWPFGLLVVHRTRAQFSELSTFEKGATVSVSELEKLKRAARDQTCLGATKGVLFVGTTGAGEVVINHPDIDPDKDGNGYIVFSTEQALDLACTLIGKVREARRELVAVAIAASARKREGHHERSG